jgi:hypothetical protein
MAGICCYEGLIICTVQSFHFALKSALIEIKVVFGNMICLKLIFLKYF